MYPRIIPGPGGIQIWNLDASLVQIAGSLQRNHGTMHTARKIFSMILGSSRSVGSMCDDGIVPSANAFARRAA